ncbi:MAG: glycosyltransferase family 39 protein, partial [Rhodospirillales bacterium]|nr:glycosyltransferase family 39 protein [Rhodospirillales bacterium]
MRAAARTTVQRSIRRFATRGWRSARAALLLAAVVLTALAWLRGPEYDEQYTLFLTAGRPRPTWPDSPLRAADAVALQALRPSLVESAPPEAPLSPDAAQPSRDTPPLARSPLAPLALAQALRATDVHPPLYFWLAQAWRAVVGDGLFALRLASVLCSLGALALLGRIGRRFGLDPALAILLTLGCYGFAYPGVIARGFALGQLLLVAGVAVLVRAVLPRLTPAPRSLLAGTLFGAALLTNYLTLFIAAAAVAWHLRRVAVRVTAGRATPVRRTPVAYGGAALLLGLA